MDSKIFKITILFVVILILVVFLIQKGNKDISNNKKNNLQPEKLIALDNVIMVGKDKIKIVEENSLSFTMITSKYNHLELKLKLAEFGIGARQRRKDKQKEVADKMKEWQNELYHQYSNRWEEIPDKYKLIHVALLIKDTNRVNQIYDYLLTLDNIKVNSLIYSILGNEELRKKKYEKAEAFFLKGIERVNNSPDALIDSETAKQVMCLYGNLGRSKLERGLDADQIKILEKGVDFVADKYPEQVYGYGQQISSAHGKLGNKEKAIEAMETEIFYLDQIIPKNDDEKYFIYNEIKTLEEYLEGMKKGRSFFIN